ncbi:GMC family oxidoreductase [Subtercola boreus]|uniref:Glucose-methanol-choline oxidoreductase N-terminal domain-containing protein n=1 Tax=Subtercola boreus TaxID=120213 RepID=A0A3E0WHM6_9MICO|nr:GMC family oxidoreductase N-terminal domain-containing protein [Subtercola boreus]RFA23663.1 hypothetical protein B7R24_01985 [Subtercola boreus]RFA24057.1 hypothetical protein B7R23_01985 [Subtercola boreus]RFA29755.1 hypothetical protein B7R25_01980 [Subtercola boreus]
MSTASQEFDYIVVGAGVAGSVLASLLSEYPDRSTLLLDAGQENPLDIGRSQGAFLLTWGDTEKNWAYQTVPQPGLAGRVVDEPRGRAVGGSNVLNIGAWLRGRPEDYDAWEQAGATGWNAEAARRAFLAIEATDRGPADLRGSDGPLRLNDIATPTALSDTLLDAYVEYGFGARGDSDGAVADVADRYQTVFVDGVRHTVADAYLTEEVRARESLTIRVGAHVSRVIIEDGRAVGAEVRPRSPASKMPTSAPASPWAPCSCSPKAPVPCASPPPTPPTGPSSTPVSSARKATSPASSKRYA